MVTLSGCVLTDGISGPSRFCGDGEWTKTESILSSDPEQVVLTLQKTWHHVRLTGTGCVHLITNQSTHQFIIRLIVLLLVTDLMIYFELLRKKSVETVECLKHVN